MNSEREDPIAEGHLDAGLKIAFGVGSPPIDSNVLKVLTAKLGRRPSVYLSARDPEDSLVKVTSESRAIIDPTGRYRVVGEIGRGGVGVVYKGHDTDLGRDVAVKVLRDEYLDNMEVLERFVEEAQIGGQLQHPGIVPVYGLGLQQGERPYFAMKLVRGETFAALLARQNGSVGDRHRLLSIFEQICQTVSYAHSRQVVHRDLKPANVMLGAFGEVQVVDWGFAKVQPPGEHAEDVGVATPDHEDTVITTVRSDPKKGLKSTAGSVFGTPAYMPPEQAAGDVRRMDQRSDVFSLGAILCEILVGEPPYRSSDGNVMAQAASGAVDGAHDRLRACGADSALVSLAIQCLSPARRMRPADAVEVAERVGAYLASVEERARQAELREARARYRTRTTGLLAATTIFVILAALGVYTWIGVEADKRRVSATGRVASAATEVGELFGLARAAGSDDSSLWVRALAAAEGANELATHADVEDEQRTGVAALLERVRSGHAVAQAEIARRARDEALKERLIILRIPVDEDLRAPGFEEREAKRLDGEYAAAFRSYLGAETFSAFSISELESMLRGKDIQTLVAAALDHWAMVRKSLSKDDRIPDAPVVGALLQGARSLDEPALSWSENLRSQSPATPDGRAALERIADEVELETLPATRLVLIAEALWSSGARTRALSLYQRAQELHSSDFGICLRLALLFELLDEPDWEAAEQTYRIAHALRPDIREVQHRRAIALGRLGRQAENLQLIEDLLRLEPNNAHWVYHLALTRDKLGDSDGSVSAFRRSLELDPESAKVHSRFGRKLEQLGRSEEALEMYHRALELEPENLGTLNDLAIVLRGRGRSAEAEATIVRALELDSTSWPLLVTHGLILWDRGELEETTLQFRRALEIDPRNLTTLLNLGAVLMEQGQVDLGLARYKEALALDLEGFAGFDAIGESLFFYAQSLSEAGKSREAMECLRLALQLQPDKVEVHTLLGTVLAQQGQLEAAAASFERAVELDPSFAFAHANLATVRLQQGRIDEAIEGYQTALSKDPRCVAALGGLASAQAARGEFELAIEGFRRALAIDPNLVEGLFGLAFLLSESGAIDEAIPYMERGLKLDPSNGQVRNAMGVFLRETGRVQDSVEALREGLKFDPASADLHANLGHGLRVLGDNDSARSSFERALELYALRSDEEARRFAEIVREQLEEL